MYDMRRPLTPTPLRFLESLFRFEGPFQQPACKSYAEMRIPSTVMVLGYWLAAVLFGRLRFKGVLNTLEL
jgi:hypothetical protein